MFTYSIKIVWINNWHQQVKENLLNVRFVRPFMGYRKEECLMELWIGDLLKIDAEAMSHLIQLNFIMHSQVENKMMVHLTLEPQEDVFYQLLRKEYWYSKWSKKHLEEGSAWVLGHQSPQELKIQPYGLEFIIKHLFMVEHLVSQMQLTLIA